MTSSILSLASLLLNNISQATGSPANTQPSLPLQQPSQGNSFGQAVVMDLSPAAMAAINGGQSTSTSSTNPISDISANIFSKMAVTYSAGNTGALNTNNSFFDQLFGGTASNSATGTASGSAASGASGTTSLASNTAANPASDSTQGTSGTTGAQGHHGGHHHHGGGESQSSSSSSGSGSSTDMLAELLSSSLNGSSSDSTDTLLASIV